MIRIAVLGQGRMGQLVAEEVLKRRECGLAGVYTRKATDAMDDADVLKTARYADLIRASDVMVDFTTADAVVQFAKAAVNLGTPFVSGTTGLNKAQRTELKIIAQRIPMLLAPNASTSFALFKKEMALVASELAGRLDSVTIIDEHHAAKRDMPSGSALALGKAINKITQNPALTDYESIRSGNTIGKHTVTFYDRAGHSELYEHEIKDRREFATGAVHAALWLHGKRPGLYTMENVLLADYEMA